MHRIIGSLLIWLIGTGFLFAADPCGTHRVTIKVRRPFRILVAAEEPFSSGDSAKGAAGPILFGDGLSGFKVTTGESRFPLERSKGSILNQTGASTCSVDTGRTLCEITERKTRLKIPLNRFQSSEERMDTNYAALYTIVEI